MEQISTQELLKLKNRRLQKRKSKNRKVKRLLQKLSRKRNRR